MWLPPGGIALSRSVGDIVEDLRTCTLEEMEGVMQVCDGACVFGGVMV